MRAVYLLDFNACSVGCEKTVENLPSDLSARVINTTNEKRQRERAFSYFLAYDLIKKAHPCDENASLSFYESGKPYIKNSSLSISLAHSDSVAAVFISDEKEDVGIDIEAVTEKSERVSDAFLKNRVISFELADENEVDIYIASIRDGITADILKEENIFLKKELSGTDKWTYCESVLKCDGVGVCGINNVADIIRSSCVRVLRVDINGKKYSLSIATKKKN